MQFQKGNITKFSDIDLALVVEKELDHAQQWEIDYSIRDWESGLACDVIFIPKHYFENETKGETIIRPILQEGIILNGLL